ncbi:MAG: ABC transporter ATP-binding protein [Oscillospiraceae bacterium]
MAILEIKNIYKKIGKKQILNNVSLSVEAGEVFGFLGPNGAGKTTTIKMVTGLLSISQGDITINGFNVKTHFEKALENVGSIIENPEMYGYLTGYENLKLFSRMHNNVTEERIQEVIKIVKLENRINDKVKGYSLGMRQRLGVAQAILHKPKLLILDEPTNGLDPAGIKDLRDTLRRLAQEEKVAVMVSSHLLAEMELMCDRFGVIDNGVISDTTALDNKETTDQVCKFDTDNQEKAKQIIEEISNEKTKYSENGLLEISATRENIAKINKKLVEDGISVFEISVCKKSLEETFIEITSNSKIN